VKYVRYFDDEPGDRWPIDAEAACRTLFRAYVYLAWSAPLPAANALRLLFALQEVVGLSHIPRR
jgi:hypothetical protein